MLRPPPISPLFPYTTLFRSSSAGALAHLPVAKVTNLARAMEELKEVGYWLVGLDENAEKTYTEVDYTSPVGIVLGDRKSTRLNSSHEWISYAVFCLKKKKKK